jgi:hypothetical protein
VYSLQLSLVNLDATVVGCIDGAGRHFAGHSAECGARASSPFCLDSLGEGQSVLLP